MRKKREGGKDKICRGTGESEEAGVTGCGKKGEGWACIIGLLSFPFLRLPLLPPEELWQRGP